MTTDLEQFRADFKRMFAHWHAIGDLSEIEAMSEYRTASVAVQDHMHDPDWMAGAAAHFRQMVEQTEAQAQRSMRIASEVRAMKEHERTKQCTY